MIKKYPGIIEIFCGAMLTAISTMILIFGAVSHTNSLILTACIIYCVATICVLIGVIRLIIKLRKKNV